MFNDNPWHKEEMKKKAQAHTVYMEQHHQKSIENSINHTYIYDEKSRFLFNKTPNIIPCKISVKDETSTQGIIELAKKYPNDKIAVLNFASYKHPGGMFMNGSIAQEEALCHDSFLYNVLREFQEEYYDENAKIKNRGLYTHKALYSQDILFFDDTKNCCSADVLTCAAPNYTTASKYSKVSRKENREVLEERIDFVFKITLSNKVENLVLGAWGCGVFGQNAQEVAEIFKKYIEKYKYCFKEIIFAIPHSRNGNLEEFRKVFC